MGLVQLYQKFNGILNEATFEVATKKNSLYFIDVDVLRNIHLDSLLLIVLSNALPAPLTEI